MCSKLMKKLSAFKGYVTGSIFVLSFFVTCCSSVFAATYYANPSGTGSTCSSGSPCSLSTGLSTISGGDTLVLQDGTYTGKITNPPSGTAGAYTIIRAANDGAAVVSDTATGTLLRLGSNYVQIEGIKFVGNSTTGEIEGAYIPGNYNKVLRCGFVVTPCTSCSNKANVTISGNYNLVEDSWAWGAGRYKFIVYGGDSVGSGSYNILRRVVARHDRELSGGFNPQATFANYQGANNLFQNILSLSSDQVSYYDNSWRGPFFLEKGQKGGNIIIDGSIALGFSGTWISDSASGTDSDPMYTAGNLMVSNSVAYGGNQGFMGSYYVRTLDRSTMSLDHCTVGSIDGATSFSQSDAGAGFGGGVDTANNYAAATNNILTGITAGTYGLGNALWNVRGVSNYNSFYGNTINYGNGSTAGANDITNVNPLAASLRYPVRIEAGSPLKGAGSGGSDIGPTILKRIGVSGTLYGETGYNTVTSENLWPWPNEARIKADMSAYPSNWPAGNLPSPQRGFTTGTSRDGSAQTLTKYVWEYLGNTIPADIYGGSTDTISPVVTAFSIPTTSSSLTVTINSLSSTDNVAVAGYMISENALQPSASDSGWSISPQTNYSFTSSGNKTLYAWAKDAVGNVSASRSAITTITTVDTSVPVVTAFATPSTSSTLTISGIGLNATDNVAVTGYMITENSIAPSAGAAGWTSTTPSTYTFSTAGSKTAYAWAKDAAGNISSAMSSSVTITISQSSSNTYYVRADGSDSNTGSSNTSGGAWLTLQKAANTVAAGDTVLVADGTYAGFYVETAGTSIAPITFRALGTGVNITTRNSRTLDGINIESWTSTPANYITIDGFNVYNQSRMGVRAIAGTGIVVKNCRVHNNLNTGILSGDTPSIQVLNNIVYNNGSSNMQHNIYISNSLSDNPIIRGNIVYSANGGNGIQLNGDWESGGDGYIDNAIIESNVVYNNAGKGFSLISVRYGRIQNNITYGNSGAGGIHLVDQLGQNFSTGNVVVNNTLDESGTATVRINALNTGNIVFNNVSIGPTGIVFEGSGNYQSNNSTSTSGFVNRAGHDYALVAGSTNINSGLSIFQSTNPPSIDLVGIVRPQNGTFDVGAYEYVATGDSTRPVVSAFNMPATSTALTVSVSILTATDAVGVTGYMITESSTAPASGAAGWSASAPTSFTFSAAGSKTAYAWAKDAAGNVSTSMSRAVTITLADVTAPVVSAFTMPTTATSLVVSVTGLTATDAVGVTGYMITESATAPLAGAAGWSASAPTNFTFSAAGSKTAYAWAKDAAGNVSAVASRTVVITLPDVTAPVVSAFTMPTTATSLFVSVTGLTATDAVGVTGYMITESTTAPLAGAAGWSASAPTNFTFSAAGSKTAYAWAKDAAGNVSAVASRTVVITLPDVTAPVVSAFTMPTTATSLVVSVTGLSATDAVGVTGFMIIESATAPSAGAAGWSASAPTNFTFSAAGSKTAYAWAKDAAGNVSVSASRTVVITLPDVTAPVVSVFTMPTTATSLVVSITGLSATDAVGVTGYMITESTTAPSAGAAGWSASAPTNFTFSAAGSKTAYAWAKDAAGNVSAVVSRTVVITLPDVTAPVVSAFTMPTTATSLVVSVTGLSATDAVGVTGYMITESATAPSAGAAGWSASAPTNFPFSAAGSKTAYAWAKDAAGNVSAGRSASVTITIEYAISDALLALQIGFGKVNPTTQQISRLDVAPVINGKSTPNGKVDTGDAIALLSKIVGKTSF